MLRSLSVPIIVVKVSPPLWRVLLNQSSLRRGGAPDPFNSVKEITSESLIALGVTKAQQQSELASELGRWIRNMCMAGEYPTALQAAQETLQSDLKHVEAAKLPTST